MPAAALHPAFFGRDHKATVETIPAWPGRLRVVATCSCLGWSTALLARDTPNAAGRARAEAREAHGDHAAANSPEPTGPQPTQARRGPG